MFNGVGKLYISLQLYGGIHADVIVYIFPHLHTALLKEINMLDMN